MSGRWSTRIRQVRDFLTRSPTPEDDNWALGSLPENLQPLFRDMRAYDRYHCTAVARRLAEHQPPPWALHGALLHDCGKPRTFGLLSRIWGVLTAAPGIHADPPARSPWRRAQQIYRWHGEYGARKARGAGLDEAGCELIAKHHVRPDPLDGSWLALFQHIDDD